MFTQLSQQPLLWDLALYLSLYRVFKQMVIESWLWTVVQKMVSVLFTSIQNGASKNSGTKHNDVTWHEKMPQLIGLCMTILIWQITKISCVSKFYVAFMLGLKNIEVFYLLVRTRQIACKEAIKLALNDLQQPKVRDCWRDRLKVKNALAPTLFFA